MDLHKQVLVSEINVTFPRRLFLVNEKKLLKKLGVLLLNLLAH